MQSWSIQKENSLVDGNIWKPRIQICACTFFVCFITVSPAELGIEFYHFTAVHDRFVGGNTWKPQIECPILQICGWEYCKYQNKTSCHAADSINKHSRRKCETDLWVGVLQILMTEHPTMQAILKHTKRKQPCGWEYWKSKYRKPYHASDGNKTTCQEKMWVYTAH